jgi:Arc/MetJ family transcription regulator
MKTTLNLPDDLIQEALKITKFKTKTDLIVSAIKHLVKQEKLQKLKNYKGKVQLDINLDDLRKR